MGCHTTYFIASYYNMIHHHNFNTVLQNCFIWVCFGLAICSVQNLTDQSRLLDEINKLKEEIQIKSSEKPQVKIVKSVEKAQDTTEPKPRKDEVKDQELKINCLEVGQKGSSYNGI